MAETPNKAARLNKSLRCGAKTRAGSPYRAPAVRGKKRCRMHGGSLGSGAPKNNQNAVKHGHYRRERIEERRWLKSFLRQKTAKLAKLNRVTR